MDKVVRLARIRSEEDLKRMFEEIADAISDEEKKILADKLLGLLLESKSDVELPANLAKVILRLEARDDLHLRFGIIKLLEATMIVEPEKTVDLVNEITFIKKKYNTFIGKNPYYLLFY
jgi:hypothetical protein